jgi:hypothetical protein
MQGIELLLRFLAWSAARLLDGAELGESILIEAERDGVM